jgi:hypothetical protein
VSWGGCGVGDFEIAAVPSVPDASEITNNDVLIYRDCLRNMMGPGVVGRIN